MSIHPSKSDDERNKSELQYLTHDLHENTTSPSVTAQFILEF
jgi:hypothetical protein